MDDGAVLKAFAEKALTAAPSFSREAQARHMIGVLELAQAGLGAEASSVAAPKPGRT